MLAPAGIVNCGLHERARRSVHPDAWKAEAVFLARMRWGGARKITKLLCRRHGIELSEHSVQEWVRGVRGDLDPLATFNGGRA